MSESRAGLGVILDLFFSRKEGLTEEEEEEEGLPSLRVLKGDLFRVGMEGFEKWG